MPPNAPCANPLLLQWMQEWVEQERDRNSRGLLTYKNAFAALRACPVTFQHPSQAQQLKGFGEKICKRLTERMEQHCRENGLPMPKRPRRSAGHGLVGQNDGDQDQDDEERPAKRQRKPKPYVPALRSGPYALILALATLEEGSRSGLSRYQLVERAQPHCDASFTAADPGKFYTAWNSMKTLLDKDLVEERGRPTRKYNLTEEGWDVARRIQQTIDPNQPVQPAPLARPEVDVDSAEPAPTRLVNNRSPSVEVEDRPRVISSYADVVTDGDGDSSSESLVLPKFRPIRLAPGTFDVHLVLDIREVRAKTDRDYSKQHLLQPYKINTRYEPL